MAYWQPTEVKRLSMREKLRGDGIVRCEKPCMSTASSSCELERKFSFYFNQETMIASMKFICDDNINFKHA